MPAAGAARGDRDAARLASPRIGAENFGAAAATRYPLPDERASALSCGVAVVPGYVRCPKCQSRCRPRGRRAVRGAGGTAVDERDASSRSLAGRRRRSRSSVVVVAFFAAARRETRTSAGGRSAASPRDRPTSRRDRAAQPPRRDRRAPAPRGRRSRPSARSASSIATLKKQRLWCDRRGRRRARRCPHRLPAATPRWRRCSTVAAPRSRRRLDQAALPGAEWRALSSSVTSDRRSPAPPADPAARPARARAGRHDRGAHRRRACTCRPVPRKRTTTRSTARSSRSRAIGRRPTT